jgi:hypothetical protein
MQATVSPQYKNGKFIKSGLCARILAKKPNTQFKEVYNELKNYNLRIGFSTFQLVQKQLKQNMEIPGFTRAPRPRRFVGSSKAQTNLEFKPKLNANSAKTILRNAIRLVKTSGSVPNDELVQIFLVELLH